MSHCQHHISLLHTYNPQLLEIIVTFLSQFMDPPLSPGFLKIPAFKHRLVYELVYSTFSCGLAKNSQHFRYIFLIGFFGSQSSNQPATEFGYEIRMSHPISIKDVKTMDEKPLVSPKTSLFKIFDALSPRGKK